MEEIEHPLSQIFCLAFFAMYFSAQLQFLSSLTELSIELSLGALCALPVTVLTDCGREGGAAPSFSLALPDTCRIALRAISLDYTTEKAPGLWMV